MLSSRTVIVIGFFYLLSACGFEPLYGSRGEDDIILEFSDIQVAPAKDRIGQLFTNELIHFLNPLRQPVAPQYRLSSTVTESTRSLAVKKSALATRANLVATVRYDLTHARTGQVVYTGRNTITVSYNIYSGEYATLAAEKDAQKRAVRELAQDTRLQLGAFFKSKARARTVK